MQKSLVDLETKEKAEFNKKRAETAMKANLRKPETRYRMKETEQN